MTQALTAEEIISILDMDFEDGYDIECFVDRLKENRAVIARALRRDEALENPPNELYQRMDKDAGSNVGNSDMEAVLVAFREAVK